MREIKFRAWDSHIKRMIGWHDPIFLHLDEKGRNVNHTMLCEYPMMHASSNSNFLKYMQYTGLKDKNGVEIYEGDIVRFHDPDKQDELLLDRINGIGFVEWADCCLFRYWISSLIMKNGFRKGFAMGDLGDLENIEVIGNIHENGELLNEPE